MAAVYDVCVHPGSVISKIAHSKIVYSEIMYSTPLCPSLGQSLAVRDVTAGAFTPTAHQSTVYWGATYQSRAQQRTVYWGCSTLPCASFLV